jgi:hypothetical protein
MSKVGIIFGYALLVMGCVTADRPPVGELKEGLNLLDTRDPSWGSNAAYVKNGRVVYLETRVGALKPEIYRLTWPEDAPNEIDVRFVNQAGRTFFIQRGGDNYVDAQWHADIAAHQNQKPLDPAELDLDLQLAKEAAGAYRIAVPTSFADHVLQMNALDREPLPSKNAELRQRFTEAKAALAKDQAYSWQWADGGRWIDTHLFSGSTGCFAWICTAKHSATRMYKDYPSLTLVQNACNHGRCYNGSGMGQNCGSYGWNAGGGWLNGETNSNTTAVSGGCATPYNWNSGGYDHLCNSDAAYELWQAKDARSDTSRGNELSFTWDNAGNYACNCNNNNDCDGDWNRPGCP